MKAFCLAVFIVAIVVLADAKPKWKKVLQEKRQKATPQEHKKYCSEIECPKYSACKLKRSARGIKAICVKCRQCSEKQQGGPVCGTDGIEYIDQCDLKYQTCMINKLGLVSVKCKGPCATCVDDKEQMIVENRLNKEKLSGGQENEEEEDEEVENRQADDQQNKEEEKNQRFKKWKQWKQYKHEFQRFKIQQMDRLGMQVTDDSNCTKLENDTLGIRLIDWFHVLRSEYIKQNLIKSGRPVELPIMPEMDLRQAHEPYPCGHHHDECREPINFMFHYLDHDDDHILGPEELEELKAIPYENCIDQFLKRCDKTNDNQLSLPEFCQCFPIEPPCLAKMKSVPTIVQRGQPIALPGHFMPRCDVDGFFMPMQCHLKGTAQFCWCVDRNGGKVEGSYKKGNVQCDDNTVNPREEQSGEL